MGRFMKLQIYLDTNTIMDPTIKEVIRLNVNKDQEKQSLSSLKSIIPLLNTPFDKQNPLNIIRISYQEKNTDAWPYSAVVNNLEYIGVVISTIPFWIS